MLFRIASHVGCQIPPGLPPSGGFALQELSPPTISDLVPPKIDATDLLSLDSVANVGGVIEGSSTSAGFVPSSAGNTTNECSSSTFLLPSGLATPAAAKAAVQQQQDGTVQWQHAQQHMVRPPVSAKLQQQAALLESLRTPPLAEVPMVSPSGAGVPGFYQAGGHVSGVLLRSTEIKARAVTASVDASAAEAGGMWVPYDQLPRCFLPVQSQVQQLPAQAHAQLHAQQAQHQGHQYQQSQQQLQEQQLQSLPGLQLQEVFLRPVHTNNVPQGTPPGAGMTQPQAPLYYLGPQQVSQSAMEHLRSVPMPVYAPGGGQRVQSWVPYPPLADQGGQQGLLPNVPAHSQPDHVPEAPLHYPYPRGFYSNYTGRQ